MTQERSDAPDTDIKPELVALRNQLEKLNSHKYIRVQNSLPRLLWNHFLRGLAMGLGTAVGATLLLSFLLILLAKIDFIPIIGDWAGQIADQIQSR